MNENSMYIWGEIHSSMVKGIIYEKHTSRLYVNFVKGSVYSYVNVSSDFVRKIFNVPSVGKFLNSNLFGKYKSSSSELDCHTFSKLAIQLNLYKTTHSTNSINPYSPSVSNGYLKQNDNQSNSYRSVI